MTFLALTNLAGPASAQQSVDGDTAIPRWLRERLADRVYNRRDNTDMVRLVQPIAQQTRDSVVGVICGGRSVAMATVVAKSGDSVYLITKRSELTGDPIRVRLPDGRILPARVAAVRRRSDLAMLVLEPNPDQSLSVYESLQPIEFQSFLPDVGAFLVSPDRTARVIGIGVVGTGAISVQHRGILGVRLEDIAQAGARVQTIYPDSGADEAGLELGDRIVAIDGRTQVDMSSVIGTLKSMFPGEVVRLTVDRDGDTLDIDAKLREAAMLNETENDARVNGPRNVRLSGFDRVIQHDTVLNPDQCGGPVLDLEMRVIGINIARAGRVVSYALPGSLLQSEVASMLAEAGGK